MITFNNLNFLKSIKDDIILVDKTVYKLYSYYFNSNKIIQIEGGENSKSFDVYTKIMNKLFEFNTTRLSTLYVIGGGTVGDLGGFVASTYMRGTKLIHIPTTLLAMVDSSIGGKNGINYNGKNLIGTYYLPNEIIVIPEFLKTLPKNHLSNGMAEVVKISLLNSGLFSFLENYTGNFYNDKNFLNHIITSSAAIKLKITSRDFKESNQRKYLNLGHTWGHALEAESKMLHGECVSIGLVEELKFTNFYHGYPSMDLINRIKSVLSKFNLPTNYNALNLSYRMLFNYLSKDKKGNELVTIVNLDEPKLVKFNQNMWEIFYSKIIKLKFDKNVYQDYRNVNNNKLEFNIPSSKSITNRVLLLASLGKGPINIKNILNSDDVAYMLSALKQSGVDIEENNENIYISPKAFYPKGDYFLGNSGTCVRFLLPSLACYTEEIIKLDGNKYMRKRPIKQLVKCLNNSGCLINYLEREGYLPLEIYPSESNFNFKIDGSLSSQYITGLLILLASVGKGKIEITGEKTSVKFINMTLDLLKIFNVRFKKEENVIRIDSSLKNPDNYTIEGDATALSYYMGWSYLTKNKIKINNLDVNSIQGDLDICKRIGKYFGELKCEKNYLEFIPEEKEIGNLVLDLDSSDTFLTWAVLFFIKLINKDTFIEFTNIKNQNMKECKRIDVLIDNLNSIGGDLEKNESGFILNGIKENSILFNHSLITKDDHRMIMSLSFLVYIKNNISLLSPNGVNKTFKTYWNEINKFGVNYRHLPTEIKQTFVLYGMPNSGKSYCLDKLKINFDHDYFCFYDIDEIIEERKGPINAIIKHEGWDYFRNIEEEIINEIFNNNESKIKIISLGGGSILSKKTRKLMDKTINILIEGNFEKNKTLPDNIENIRKDREIYYNSLKDYKYENKKSNNFFRWFTNLFYKTPIGNNSIFECITSELKERESTISNLIEIRDDLIILDNEKYYSTFNLYNRPMIYTLRSPEEGGNNLFQTNYKKRILSNLDYGFNYVDIEINKDFNIYKHLSYGKLNYTTVIGSLHKFDEEQIKLLHCNYDILKLVIPKSSINKIKNYSNILIDSDDIEYRLKNNYLTPLKISNQPKAYKTQVDKWEYLKLKYEKEKKKFIFIFGNSLAKSPSPFIHNYVFNKLDLNYNYYLFESDNYEDYNKLIEQEYFYGASVTMPFKKYNWKSKKNKKKSFNTILKKENKIELFNTDVLAIEKILSEILVEKDDKFNNIFILGTGGAAVGAYDAAEKFTEQIFLVGRSDKANIKFKKFLGIKLEENDLVINCLPPEVKIIDDYKNYVDMSYGLHNIYCDNNGFEILKLQAIEQFKIWFGERENLNKYYQEALDCFLKIKLSI